MQKSIQQELDGLSTVEVKELYTEATSETIPEGGRVRLLVNRLNQMIQAETLVYVRGRIYVATIYVGLAINLANRLCDGRII